MSDWQSPEVPPGVHRPPPPPPAPPTPPPPIVVQQQGGAFSNGVKFGIAFLLIVFVVPPVLALGGCALLLAAGSSQADEDRKAKEAKVAALPRPDARALAVVARAAQGHARRELANDRSVFPREVSARRMTVQSSKCRFIRHEKVPLVDEWSFVHTCRTRLEDERGRKHVYDGRYETYSPPPYAGTAALDGDYELLRRDGDPA